MDRDASASGQMRRTTVDSNLMSHSGKRLNKTSNISADAAMTLAKKSGVDGDSQDLTLAFGTVLNDDHCECDGRTSKHSCGTTPTKSSSIQFEHRTIDSSSGDSRDQTQTASVSRCRRASRLPAPSQ